MNLPISAHSIMMRLSFSRMRQVELLVVFNKVEFARKDGFRGVLNVVLVHLKRRIRTSARDPLGSRSFNSHFSNPSGHN